MPFYVTLAVYVGVMLLIAYFIKVDVYDNRRQARRIAQLEHELAFTRRQLIKSRDQHGVTKRQLADMRRNSLVTFNERVSA